jgi:hypothetical protein
LPELYKSKSGTLTANEELELVTLDLRAFVRKLEVSFPLVEPDASPNMAENYSEEQKPFRTICEKAANVAEELLSRLERIKVKDGKKRRWKSFEQALRGAWSHDEVRVLNKHLSTLSQALETQVLFSMRFDIISRRQAFT